MKQAADYQITRNSVADCLTNPSSGIRGRSGVPRVLLSVWRRGTSSEDGMFHVYPHLLYSVGTIGRLLGGGPTAEEACLGFQVVLTVEEVDLPIAQGCDRLGATNNCSDVVVLNLELSLCQQRASAPVAEVEVSIVTRKVICRRSRSVVRVFVRTRAYR